VFPVFLVVVFSFLSAYLYMCVCSIWAMLPELNKMNNGDHNFINITNKVAHRACVALVLTDVSRLLLQHARHSTYDFSYTEMHGLDSVL